MGSTDKDKSTFTREEVTKLTGVTVTDIQYCPKAGTTKIDEYTIYYVAIKFKADDVVYYQYTSGGEWSTTGTPAKPASGAGALASMPDKVATT